MIDSTEAPADQEVMRDWGAEAHAAAAAHLARIWDSAYADEAGIDLESPESAPFCGCDDCVIREVLAGAWPVIEQYRLATHDGR